MARTRWRPWQRRHHVERQATVAGMIFRDIERCGYLIDWTFGDLVSGEMPDFDQNKSTGIAQVIPLPVSHSLVNRRHTRPLTAVPDCIRNQNETAKSALDPVKWKRY